MSSKVNTSLCTGCESCVSVCPVEAISMVASKATVAADKCVECGACVAECPVEALSI